MEDPVTAKPVPTLAGDGVRDIIAEKIRTDSQTLAKPIHVESLGVLLPDMKPEEIVGQLTQMVRIERYEDVRVHISACGAAYLYSENSISTGEAIERIAAEETQTQIAEQIRDDSGKHLRLTALASLGGKYLDLGPERIKQYAQAILNDPNYPDIRQVAGPAGLEYFYSVNFMTQTYARLLARVEAHNPAALIAETVREESLIYPRPTRVGLFYAPVFQLQECHVETIVESMLVCDEYQDIKKIVAPTDAIYLYSDRYLDQALAERYVQWEEVEKLTNQ
jgi:hypothetical protein